jgi:hypothetical protein
MPQPPALDLAVRPLRPPAVVTPNGPASGISWVDTHLIRSSGTQTAAGARSRGGDHGRTRWPGEMKHSAC